MLAAVLLITDGVQLPVMPLFEVFGNDGTIPPLQRVGTFENSGSVFELTTTVIVLVAAHCPLSGVNVYVVVAVLFMEGLQLPVIPFEEVVSKEIVLPVQIAGICVNEGRVNGVICKVPFEETALQGPVDVIV